MNSLENVVNMVATEAAEDSLAVKTRDYSYDRERWIAAQNRLRDIEQKLIDATGIEQSIEDNIAVMVAAIAKAERTAAGLRLP